MENAPLHLTPVVLLLLVAMALALTALPAPAVRLAGPPVTAATKYLNVCDFNDGLFHDWVATDDGGTPPYVAHPTKITMTMDSAVKDEGAYGLKLTYLTGMGGLMPETGYSRSPNSMRPILASIPRIP